MIGNNPNYALHRRLIDEHTRHIAPEDTATAWDGALYDWLRPDTYPRGASFENERVIRSGASPVVSVKS